VAGPLIVPGGWPASEAGIGDRGFSLTAQPAAPAKSSAIAGPAMRCRADRVDRQSGLLFIFVKFGKTGDTMVVKLSTILGKMRGSVSMGGLRPCQLALPSDPVVLDEASQSDEIFARLAQARG
jgi:hypothetical protein